MNFEIKQRYTRETLYSCELPENIWGAPVAVKFRYVILSAVSAGRSLAYADLSHAPLSHAYLSGVNLSCSDLRDANLSYAALSHANMSHASISGAFLIGAYLRDANLTDAYLRDANLRDADLRGADLTFAQLHDAELFGADLSCANLDDIRKDFFDVLSWARPEVPALIQALKEGRVDGSVYAGPCACLVGTIANARNVDYSTLPHDSGRPIERFFSAIRRGDVPTTNPVSAIVTEWAENWIANQA